MKEQLDITKEKMSKSLNIRAGRANPAILDKVMVDYYGAPTPINQMAAISVAEARILVIQPWDATSLKAIEKAILASDVGITPTNDGKALRLAFPQLTEERRKDLCKSIKKYGEECKVAIRSIRRDSIEKFKAMIEKNGTVDSVDVWGKRRLAYLIDDQPEGFYAVVKFTSEPAFPAELDRVFNITEGVMRSLIVAQE